jgi:hypothetical protein
MPGTNEQENNYKKQLELENQAMRAELLELKAKMTKSGILQEVTNNITIVITPQGEIRVNKQNLKPLFKGNNQTDNQNQ